MTVPLPIDGVLPQLLHALDAVGCAVLCAPPGAGKTTRVPLALLDAQWIAGKRILMLEPRRLAARAAATRMAHTLGTAVGGTVGYRMRLDTRVSHNTRIEVVTEGVLTRMLQHDPALDNVGIVIFDEFHERSVHADLGLALTLQSRALLRPDLRILVMSATLDADAVATLLDHAPVIVSDGRAWPVETRFLARPIDGFVDSATARVVASALDAHDGDVLVFLPGAAEIRRVESSLRGATDAETDIYPLYGQLSQAVQDRALAPSPPGRRKVVLATSIAETSLTIDGVRVVVDSGLMRVPRFSPRTGMSRLETMRVTRDSADQRRGRAGRTAPGICYRVWTAADDAGLVPHRAPEILETDLAPLALELAAWGVTDPAELLWLDAPPRPSFAHARDLLRTLHAIDNAGAITPHGRALAEIGLHPRLAHMLMRARTLGIQDIAADVAALLSERDIFRAEHARDPDLRTRVDAIRTGRARTDTRADGRADAATLDRVRREAASWRARLPRADGGDPLPTSDVIPVTRPTAATASEYAGLLLAFAYPDRIAQRRAAGSGRYLLRNGRGASCDVAGSFGDAEFIAIAALDDTGREARVQMGAPLERSEIEAYFADDITTATVIEWDDSTDSVRAVRTRALGAITLEQNRITLTDDTDYAPLLLDAIERKGIDALPWTDDARALRLRIVFARTHQPDAWPDSSDPALLATLDEWLLPFLTSPRRLSDIRPDHVAAAVLARLSWDQQRSLDAFAPTHIVVPTGSRVAIDYTDPSSPVLAVRLQEMFGLADTPRIAGGATPITLHLLSPARRPVQVTRDLAGFWAGTYFDVRKDLRGRYPRHYWPDDPLHAEPTRRVRHQKGPATPGQ